MTSHTKEAGARSGVVDGAVPAHTTFDEIAACIEPWRRVAVLSHQRPDGDAIGSQVALGLCLQGLGKEVILLNEDGLPESMAFLPGSSAVQQPNGSAVEVDGVFALDTATQVRLGDRCNQAVSGAPAVINIDHHPSNPRYGSLNYIDAESPATGQIIYQLIASQNWPMTREIAENLFAAISTDTGSFQYPATTGETFRIVGELVSLGLDIGGLSAKLYHNHPLRRIELLRALLNTLEVSPDGRVASWELTQETFQRLQLLPDDSEDLINVIRAVDTVQVAVFFEELTDGQVRVSSRSKTDDVDVSKICQAFNGGGHARAAGARISGSLSEAKRRFLQAIHEALPAA